MSSIITIQGYQFDKSKAVHSPNGTWYKATNGGNTYFLKKFKQPKYPKEGINPELYKAKRKECEEWIQAKKKLISTLNEIGNGTGNIISPRDIFRDDLSFYQATFWIDVQTDSLDKIKNYSEDMKLMILKTYSAALKKVHSKNIIHGDLKPDNILIGKSASGKPVAKLIDFDDSYFSKEALAPDLTTVTDAYQSPELAAYKLGKVQYRERLTCASDVFASAIIFHQFFTGEMPRYKGDNSGRYLYEAVAAGDGYKLDKRIPTWLQNVLHDMLKLNPEERITMEQVHEAIANKSYGKVEMKVEDPKVKKEILDDSIDVKKKEYSEIKTVYKKIPVDLENYTEASIKKLELAKNKVKALSLRDSLTTFIECKHNLEKAILTLEKKQKSIADLTELNLVLEDIPSNLEVYSEESIKELAECIRYIEKNKLIAPQTVVDSMSRKLRKVITNLKVKSDLSDECSIFSFRVANPLPKGFSKVEIVSELKVRVYTSDGTKMVLSKIAAEGMGLIVSKRGW